MTEIFLKDARQKSLVKPETFLRLENSTLFISSPNGEIEKRLKGFSEENYSSYWIDCENRSILVESVSEKGVEKLVTIFFQEEDFEIFFEPHTNPNWGNYIVALKYSF